MRVLKLAAVVLSMLLLLAACTTPTSKIRIGTAEEGGTYSIYGSVLCKIFGKARPHTDFEVKNTAGSAANLRLLSDGYLELAIAQSDVADEAYYGSGLFQDDPRTGYSAVASLYTEACQIVVRADSPIQTVDDLLGKVVSIGEEGSGVLHNAQSILECCGLSLDMVEVRNLSRAQAVQALRDGEIDAFFCTIGAPAQALTELAEETPIRLLSLEEHQLERLLKVYPAYLPTTVPAGTYPGQEQDAAAIGVRALLVASDYLDQETVYALLSALYKHCELLPSGTEPVLEELSSGITIPCHPGAIQFFDAHHLTYKEDRP